MTFESPLPLWPPALAPGASASARSRYRIDGGSIRFWIEVTSAVHGWERVSVELTFVCLVAACVPLHLLLAPRFPLAATMAPLAVFSAPSVVSSCGYDTNFATASGLWLLQARRAGW